MGGRSFEEVVDSYFLGEISDPCRGRWALHQASARPQPAAIASTFWLLISKPDSLWVKVLTQKYLATSSIHVVRTKHRDSPLWKQLLKHRCSILDNVSWVVGNGSHISVIHDRWIPNVGPLQLALSANHGPMMVYDLITRCQGILAWNLNLISSLWGPDLSAKVGNITIGGRDIPCWGQQTASCCPFKDLFQSMGNRPIAPQWPWKYLWKMNIPPKLWFLAWRVLRNILPT